MCYLFSYLIQAGQVFHLIQSPYSLSLSSPDAGLSVKTLQSRKKRNWFWIFFFSEGWDRDGEAALVIERIASIATPAPFPPHFRNNSFPTIFLNSLYQYSDFSFWKGVFPKICLWKYLTVYWQVSLPGVRATGKFEDIGNSSRYLATPIQTLSIFLTHHKQRYTALCSLYSMTWYEPSVQKLKSKNNFPIQKNYFLGYFSYILLGWKF